MQRQEKVFSIIIPTYNRPGPLKKCLEALAKLDYPRDRFEVVIVDDGGSTPLDSLVDDFRNWIDLTLLHQPNRGPASARNKGAAHSRGRFLAFTDDDCAPAMNWLRALQARFETASDPVMIGGQVVNALASNPYAIASQFIVDIGCRYHNSNPDSARFLTANNLAVATEFFGAQGGFSTAFRITASEDRELCGRWLHRGYRIIYAPEIVVYHAHVLTWRTFWQQHFTYGRGAFQLQRTRLREGWVLFKPDLRYYADLLLRPLAPPITWRSLRLLGLVVESQSASTFGMIAEWLRSRNERISSTLDV